MTDRPASDRYRILIDDVERPKRWFRSVGVLIANVASWFDGFGAGPTNPGGRTITVVDATTGSVVLEFAEEFGDDARFALATVEHDLGSQTIGEFEAKWL